MNAIIIQWAVFVRQVPLTSAAVSGLAYKGSPDAAKKRAGACSVLGQMFLGGPRKLQIGLYGSVGRNLRFKSDRTIQMPIF